MAKYFLRISIFVLIFSVLIFDVVTKTESETLYIELNPPFCTENVRGKLDSYFVDLQNLPSARGIIYLVGKDELEGQFLSLKKSIENHIEFRNFDPSRIKILRSVNEESISVQLWVIPEKAELPKPGKILKNEKVVKTVKFDEGYADISAKTKALEFARYDGAAETCDLKLNFEDFSKVLLADSNLTGYLVIFNSKKRNKKINELAVDNLIKNYQIPHKRIKTIYGADKNEPTIELWLVPQSDVPPQIENNSYKKQ